jgi:hypothetical protein
MFETPGLEEVNLSVMCWLTFAINKSSQTFGKKGEFREKGEKIAWKDSKSQLFNPNRIKNDVFWKIMHYLNEIVLKHSDDCKKRTVRYWKTKTEISQLCLEITKPKRILVINCCCCCLTGKGQKVCEKNVLQMFYFQRYFHLQPNLFNYTNGNACSNINLCYKWGSLETVAQTLCYRQTIQLHYKSIIDFALELRNITPASRC